ncbi:unnamed protein product [Caenorhabditis auriculariae]|uniref:Transmembrane protein 98 n=1 Tax=Caenorhabditis auriculariae TaxID=2777116 RepID=A0A8S1HPM7_9PELO|nr:unnamed protein product [Caenorhabditis auriculariae]
MDVVVYLALGVLAVVFAVSLVILIIMCYRRRYELSRYKSSPLRFSKLSEIDNIENLVQLSPLIGEILDKNSWVYDVSGLLQHCVAVLRLCHNLTEKLASAPLSQAPPQLSEGICSATQRVMPRFDDLLCAVASPSVDVRVLEARATSLATVCWALFLPFSLLNVKYKEILSVPLAEMEQHLTALRAAADLAERAEMGKVPVDWARMDEVAAAAAEAAAAAASAEGHDGDDVSHHLTETTPLVSSSSLATNDDDVPGATPSTSSHADHHVVYHPEPMTSSVGPKANGSVIVHNSEVDVAEKPPSPVNGHHPIDPKA